MLNRGVMLNRIIKLRDAQNKLDPVKIGFSLSNKKWSRIECLIYKIQLKIKKMDGL